MAEIVRYRRLGGKAARRRPSRLRALALTLLAFAMGAVVMALATPGGLDRLAARLRPSAQEAVVTVGADSITASFTLCAEARGSCVVDGDTFDHAGLRYRIADIDTPETHDPACAAERALGERATRRLEQLLNQGPFQLLPADRDQDRYGRKLRLVSRDGQSLGAILVAEGLAHVWDGSKHPWC